MNILVIYSHFDEASLTHQFYAHTIERLKQAGHQVKARNLYKIGFNPVLSAQELAHYTDTDEAAKSQDVLREQAYVKWAQMLVFIYPIWWWNQPAILKGWLDRVLTPGFAFQYAQGRSRGLLTDKTALLLQTAGMPATYPPMSEKSYLFRKTMSQGVLQFCGIQTVHTLMLNALFLLKPEEFSQQLQQIDQFLQLHVPSAQSGSL